MLKFFYIFYCYFIFNAFNILYYRETAHQAFTDFPFLLPNFLTRRFGFTGKIDPIICMEAVVSLTLQFLKQNFDGEENGLDSIISRYSNFIVEGTTLELNMPLT